MTQATLRPAATASRPARPRPAPVYALVLCCCLALVLLRWFVPLLGTGGPGMLLALAPAFLCAWYAGARAGLAATLGTLAVVATVGPHTVPTPGILRMPAVLSLTFVGLWGVAISLFAERAHAAGRRAGEALEAQRAGEHRLEVLLNSFRDWAVILLDNGGKVQGWNAGAKRLFGYRAEDILGRHVCRLFTGQTMQLNLPEREMAQAAEFGRYENDEWRARADGSRFRAHSVTMPLRDPRGGMSGFLVVARDITESEQEQAQLRASLTELRDLAQHLHATKEAERGRIAREMHDELGQSLACLKMDVAGLRNLEVQTPELEGTCSRLLERVDGAIRSMRRLVTELRPRVLDDLGLTAAVEWQAQEFQSRTGIECALEEPVPEIVLDRERSGAVFRIFQEALTNVARHSGATRVEVTLVEEPSGISLEVRDNGRGIPEAELTGRRSMGLLGMRERALSFGGTVSVQAGPEGGTVVSARLPLEARR